MSDADEPTRGRVGTQAPRAPRDAAGARHVLLVGGSPQRPAPALVVRLAAEADLVVACDSGADACLAAGVLVDVLIGDNDSLSPDALRHARACGAVEVGFPMDKDSVDLRLAISWVRTNCPRAHELTFTGVCGGRPDHALAVWGILARSADLAPRVEEDDFSARILAPQGTPTWELAPEDEGRTLSVVALLGPATVSERGCRWEVDHAHAEPLDDLGISNVVEAPNARIEVHEGVALVVLLRIPIEKQVTAI